MTDDGMRAAWLRGNEIGAASSGPIPAEASRLMAATATPDRAVIALDDFRMSKLYQPTELLTQKSIPRAGPM